MIRNTLFGLSLLALTTGSAFAGTPVHHAASRTVAQAPAGDTAAPTDKPAPAKKEKKAKKEKAPAADKAAKDAPKTEGTKEMKAPAPETK